MNTRSNPSDQALYMALDKYREIYPEGAISLDVQEKAVLNVESAADKYLITVCYWLNGKTEPYCFFEAEVNKLLTEVCVTTCAAANTLQISDLAFNGSSIPEWGG